MDRQIDRQTNRQLDRQIDRLIDRWMSCQHGHIPMHGGHFHYSTILINRFIVIYKWNMEQAWDCTAKFPEISPQQHGPLDWHPLPWRWSPGIRGKKQQDPQRTDDPRIEIFLLSGSSKQRDWNFQLLELFICNFSRVDNLRALHPAMLQRDAPQLQEMPPSYSKLPCDQLLFCSVLFGSCALCTRTWKRGGAFTQHSVSKKKQKVTHCETNGTGLGNKK